MFFAITYKHFNKKHLGGDSEIEITWKQYGDNIQSIFSLKDGYAVCRWMSRPPDLSSSTALVELWAGLASELH